ncbi:LOW QUALITY PROTEIN: pregnancy zone protein-like [Boleophthalmus pectinirostris]|uniref:LOW QUALITY PROTEIN: pregnancy zone protein-like n=1 Tax=Boleophthalmus pectinirostris TaxID=150288 RepID=UPI002430F19E|nr:LOW QUALITY PROTEIN: pregnancy zone protein-like [Boleophthalmus pectinirostris]
MGPGCSSWWRRLLLVLALSLGASADPQFLVVLPAVVESGSTVKFCMSLLQVSEELNFTVSLIKDEKTSLLTDTVDDDTNTCRTFQAPVVEDSEIQNFEFEIKGKNFQRWETHKIQIKNHGLKTFIQTDKPLYLPGQTVHFRVVTLDSKLRPANGSYELVEMKDYRGNRVAQWLEQSSSGRILQLTFDLDPHAVEGTYSVSVKVKGQRHPVTPHTFVVEKYVLPKFSVEVEAPDEVSIALEELSFKVCTKYTFGQSVPGQVEVSVCRDFEPQRYILSPKVNPPVCHKEVQEVPKDGCASFSIPTSQFKNISRLEAAYSINAMMIEEGTDLKQSVTQKIKISYEIGKVEFVNPPNRYNPGEVLELQVKVVHYNNTPVSHTEVHLITEDDDELQKLKTDQDGHVTFSFNTSSYSDSVGLMASLYEHDRHSHLEPHFSTAFLQLQEIKPVSLHTRTTSSLEVKGEDRTLACGDKESFTVGYSIVGEGQGTINIIYLVLSRGVIVKYGHYSSYMDTMMEGELTFDLEITGDLVPAVTVVTYAVLPSANVIATSREYSTEKCFTNKVQVQFSPPSSVPGEDSSLSVSAAPLSLCGLSAVDKSVLIQKPGKSLDPDKFLSLLPVQRSESFPDSIEDPQECTKVRSRRDIILRERNNEDVYHELKKRGLKLVTNLFIRTPSCVNFRGIEYHGQSPGLYRTGIRFSDIPVMMNMIIPEALIEYDSDSPPPPPPIVTVRTFFPETWIWDLMEVGPSGQASLSVSVPDTITSWETDAFCLSSDQGIGLAARQQLTVFQPFFLEQVLPYSIIRGESFILKATVFNYLQSCIMMDVQAAPSAGFTLTPLSSDQYRSCLCGNERKTLSWILLASSLGNTATPQ